MRVSAPDALHRQINLAPEGSCLASASHAMQPACTTRTGDRSAPVRVEDPVQTDCTADECCAASFCAGLAADPHTRMVVAARSVALFGLADVVLGKCKACQRLAMHPSLF